MNHHDHDSANPAQSDHSFAQGNGGESDAASNEFDLKAKTWDTNPDRVARVSAIAKAIDAALPRDPTLRGLEYGCGTGLLSFQLTHRFAHITMMDNSRGMLDVLREKIAQSGQTNMEIQAIDLMKTSFTPTKLFNVIYCSMVLHHIKDADKMVAIWYALLEQTGFLCVADLDSDNGLFHGSSPTEHHGFNRARLAAMATEAGFSSVSFSTVYHISKEIGDGTRKNFPLFLMIARK